VFVVCPFLAGDFCAPRPARRGAGRFASQHDGRRGRPAVARGSKTADGVPESGRNGSRQERVQMNRTAVLMVNSYHYPRGGADKVYLETGKGFEQRDWNVAYFAMKHEKNQPSPYSEYFADEIEYGNISGIKQKLVSASKVVWSFEAQRKIKALIRAHKPKIAHAHQVYHHLSPSVFVTLKNMGVPTIMTAHDLKIACPAYKMLSRGEICERCKGGKVWNVALRSCIKDSRAASALIAAESALHKSIGVYRRHVDWLVVPSVFYKNKLIEWGYPSEKIVYIPNYAAVGEEPATKAGKGVIYFGRLSSEKGVATLVRAAALSGAPTVVAGDGEQREELERLAASLGAPVVFAGRLGGDALWDAVRSARVAVLPSEWYENAPLSVLEAFHLRKPVIGADIGGIPELVEHGRTGWTFPAGDAEALADRMRAAVEAPDGVVEEMGAAGAEKVRVEFGRDRYFDALTELYRRAMAA
jgi:glycosyltransferase involved in cell wall biosynthesis